MSDKELYLTFYQLKDELGKKIGRAYPIDNNTCSIREAENLAIEELELRKKNGKIIDYEIVNTLSYYDFHNLIRK